MSKQVPDPWEELAALLAGSSGADGRTGDGSSPGSTVLLLEGEAGRVRDVRPAWEILCAELPGAAARHGLTATAAITGNRFWVHAVPAPGAGEAAVAALAAHLSQVWVQNGGPALRAGSSGPPPADTDLAGHCRLALAALCLGRPDCSVHHLARSTLPITHRFLLSMPLSRLSALAMQLLSPLGGNCTTPDPALLATLTAYLDANGNIRKTATRLFVHRNTVVYRLQRIQGMLGVKLEDAEGRMGLHLAVLAHRLCQCLEGGPSVPTPPLPTGAGRPAAWHRCPAH